ncbi:transposable element Tcb1 transposase [Trichonephila clavipes]|nr:transposable element Tcb1 transposase [Trichonephila clavipes]
MCLATVDSLLLHWCAKIKDEVEKLAYQLNERGRVDRKTNQEIKTNLDAYPRSNGFEEGRSVTSVAAEFGIAHIVSRLWETISNYRNSYPKFQYGLSSRRETTPQDDSWYIVLQARRNRRQTAGEIARDTTQATDDRYRVLPRPEDCTVVVCLHTTPVRCTFNARPSEKAFFCGAGNTGIETMNGMSTLCR